MRLFFLLLASLTATVQAASLDTDLLIVGGNESACAAAVQAARLGVKRIILVNDIEWLGGQFSAEGVGCLDEWITVAGRRTHFPRSGLFLEMVRRIRAHNSAKYGLPCPGNAFCGTETIEPAAAAGLFEELVKPHLTSGVLRIERGFQPVTVQVDGGSVTGVTFERTDGAPGRLNVRARLTMDASDWGDVIRLSGARYAAGPDLRGRFQEPSAPEQFDDAGAQEMNPLSWCVVLREAPGEDATIPRPPTYDPRSFTGLDKIQPWVDNDMGAGIYTPAGNSPYTHRRLVDRWHNNLLPGTEATFLNYPTQDYPLCQLPQRVLDALEKARPGASRENIVHLGAALRKIIFDDAKQHALGMLYHLQTAVHERVGDFPQSFRHMRLTTEFGTADGLPPKPYVREGLRLEALSMLTENDIRAQSREPKWAKVMPPDSVFGFQFNIDFHPTRRSFVTADRNGPWRFVHTESRGWHTDTDRAVFPLRGLIPVEMNGLIGAGKNIGVSSVVQSALRLHGQMMHVGQAGATLAWLCLRENVQPRQVAANPNRVDELQLRLARGAGGPGVLLWPWQDLSPDDPHFEAVNMLAVRGLWKPEPDNVLFEPDKPVTKRELVRLLARIHEPAHATQGSPAAPPLFTDVPERDADRAAIERLARLRTLNGGAFNPDAEATVGLLVQWLGDLKLPVAAGLQSSAPLPLRRSDAAIHLWRAVRLRESLVHPAPR